MCLRADLSVRRAAALALALLAAWVCSSASHASTLDGALADWVTQKAGPELVEVLGNHPRFKGETLTVVTMRDGAPSTRSTALNRALEEAVTHQLLKQSQVRVTWRSQQTQCGAPRSVPYLLGIEISNASRSRASVNIVLVDVEENIWVPGVHLSWRGVLSRNEQLALRKEVSRSPLGTVDRPLAAENAGKVAERLYEQMRCAFPRGLDGTVTVGPADSSQMRPIAEALRSRVRQSSQFETPAVPEDARWIIALRPTQRGAGGSATRLDLALTETSRGSEQQVASVFVRGMTRLADTEPDRNVGQDQHAVTDSETAVEPVSTGLLSALIQTSSGPCPDRLDQQCASVEIEVLQPSYLLVFRTQNGNLTGVQCKSHARRSEASRKRYRLSVHPDVTTGLYVLATTERAVARSLQSVLRRAPGSCSNTRHSTARWLDRLSNDIASYADAVEWRAIHLDSEAALKVADR